jgi:hypothetical protein
MHRPPYIHLTPTLLPSITNSAPGGAGVFAYAFCCAPCAAGDVAVAAGRDYAMACCVPILIAGVAGVPVHCCFWSGDRAALASRYGVHDENAGNACCLFCCYFSSCLLAQELNHIAANRGKQLGGTVQVRWGSKITGHPFLSHSLLSPQPIPSPTHTTFTHSLNATGHSPDASAAGHGWIPLPACTLWCLPPPAANAPSG